MRIFLVALLLTGCMPKTIVYGPTGLKQFETSADATTLAYTGPGTSLNVTDLNHSIPLRNIGRIFTSIFTAVGGWITTISVLKKP